MIQQWLGIYAQSFLVKYIELCRSFQMNKASKIQISIPSSNKSEIFLKAPLQCFNSLIVLFYKCLTAVFFSRNTFFKIRAFSKSSLNKIAVNIKAFKSFFIAKLLTKTWFKHMNKRRLKLHLSGFDEKQIFKQPTQKDQFRLWKMIF